MEENAIVFENINKYYDSSNVQACNNVSFAIKKGKINAICGENGAGKSTLMNILFGLETADDGKIIINNKETHFSSPKHAISHGIGMVHQHFMLVKSYTVEQNILLGIESKFFTNKNANRKYVLDLAKKYSLPIDPDRIVETLDVGLMQRVEILKMLARDISTLILDEPTAVLTPTEVKPFLETLKKLAKMGTTIIFISHKLQEVLEVSDNIVVMRKGRVVGQTLAKDTDMNSLADMMVGRKVLLKIDKEEPNFKDTVLSLKNVCMNNIMGSEVLHNVSFDVRAGEIYGIAGVSGNGQESLVAGIVGLGHFSKGEIIYLGQNLNKQSIKERKDLGIGHVPQDRINGGLNILANVEENVLIGLQNKPEFNSHHLINSEKINNLSKSIINDYHVAGASPKGIVKKLSGGNMQKIVLGREISQNPKLLIIDQPTRGLDVGSIEFVYHTVLECRKQNVAILLISVEIEELMTLSDKIGVMCGGNLQGELIGSDINEHNIGILMAGGKI